MKTRGKVLLATLSAAMLVTASVMGTLAYLQDTDEVVNTFTVGKVGLSLDEAKVDLMGDEEGGRWHPTESDTAQEYKLMPGHEYTKDPTVTVDAGSEDAFVRMMATITYKDEADAVFAKYPITDWIDIDADWVVNGAPETTKANGFTTRTYEFRYDEVVASSATATKLDPLFTTLTVPGTVTNEEIAYLDGMTIAVEAHAIQKDGFGTADAAWAAFSK